jgi:hypothetical protein
MQRQPTSPVLDNLLDLLFCLHSAQIEGLDDRACGSQLGRVVWRRRKLLNHLSAHACGGLLPAHNGAVAEVAFNEEDHLFVADQDVIAAHDVEPALQRRLEAGLVLVGADAGGCGRGRDGGDNGLGTGGDEVLAELDELGVDAAHVAELCSAELGEVGVDIEAHDGVLLPIALEASDLCL